MTKEEFIKKYKENKYDRSKDSPLKSIPKDIMFVEWVCGGMSGGNCYGDEPKESTWIEDEPEFESLDSLLEAECKREISYIQYKKLYSILVKTTEYREREYYGNYTDNKIKYIELEKLYDYLVEKNLI